VIGIAGLLFYPLVGVAAEPPAAPEHGWYFRAAGRAGLWSLTDPAGHDFFSLGINVITPADGDGVKPPKYDGLVGPGTGAGGRAGGLRPD
jgi:hypothetical protein